MKIKSLVVVAVLATAILFSGTGVNAQTTNVQALIAQLQAQIQSLLQQIAQMQAQQGTTTPGCTSTSYYSSTTGAPCGPYAQPTITSVQAYAENQNIVHAGERTFIYGNNLSGVTAIYLASQIAPMDRTATTNSNLAFFAPSTLPTGTASIYVQTAAGVNSNSILVQTIASTTTQPSITPSATTSSGLEQTCICHES